MKPENQFAWIHMVVVAFAYAVLVFIAVSLFGSTRGWSFYIAWTMLVPVLVVFGFWAALGMGAMWLRAIIFSLLGPMLFAVATASFFLGFFWDGVSSIGPIMSPSKLICMVALISFGVCVACQVPFWFFRIVFGWQLIQVDRDWSQNKISIKDIFLLTAIFAFAFALPRFGVGVYFDMIAGETQVGYTESMETDEVDADGNRLEFKDVLVTEDNIEEVRETKRKQNGTFKSGMSLGILVYSAIVAFIALLFAPAVSLSLRKSGTSKEVLLAAFYLFATFMVIGFLVVFFSFGTFVFWGQLIPYLIGFALVFVAAAMIPLLVSRSRGIRLANNRDFRERRNQEKTDGSPGESISLATEH